jgi:phospholipase C
LTPKNLPVSSFFAKQYLVCNRWFAPLPTSTQPNRLVAMSG